MTRDDMQRGIALLGEADKLHRQLTNFVLLKRSDPASEYVSLGDPVTYKQGDYHLVKMPLTDELRRLAFRMWRKETALKFNNYVRELNQLGVTHNHRLIEFSPQTGEPK